MKRNNLIYTGLVSCLLMATTACSDYLDGASLQPWLSSAWHVLM